MKTASTLVFAIALCSTSLMAQQPKTVQWLGGRTPIEAADAEPAAMQKIFNNLGKSPNTYHGGGFVVLGPAATNGPQSIALPFTPKADSHIDQVRTAIQYISGANQVNISIYADASGVPGTLLAGPVTVTHLPTFFHCCKTTTANFSSVSVTGGTQYWIVADTPASGTGSDFTGAWNFVYSKLSLGSNSGTGWFAFDPNEEVAAAVYGTIP
jgi:hypothetical protein